MPTYTYRCTNENCDSENIEVVQKITDEPLHLCNTCLMLSLKRVIAPVGTIFKGYGWTPKGRKHG